MVVVGREIVLVYGIIRHGPDGMRLPVAAVAVAAALAVKP